MRIEQRADALVVGAPAKLNLFLEVLSRRPDGYHELATLMVAVNLEDTLWLRPAASQTFELTCDAPTLSTNEDNLVSRAGLALKQYSTSPLGAAVHLQKRIPMAAGLAGGSSDAAGTLLGLNELWRLGLSRAELIRIAATIGSDVPFFLTGPAAWCTGRGEKVEPVTLGQQLWFVVGCPERGLSTAEVYRHVAVPGQPQRGEEMRRATAAGDPDWIGRLLFNRLQEAAAELEPEVGRLIGTFESLGLPGVLMSGSGSSVFGICRDEAQAREAALKLGFGRDEVTRVFVVRTCSSS